MSNNSINTNYPIEISKGGTGNNVSTTNGVAYNDGTKINFVPPGSNNTVLTSNGALLPPSFQLFSSGGAYVLLSTQAATSVRYLTFNQFSVAYNSYLLYFSCNSVSISNFRGILSYQVSFDNGVTWTTPGTFRSVIGVSGGNGNGSGNLGTGPLAPYANIFISGFVNIYAEQNPSMPIRSWGMANSIQGYGQELGVKLVISPAHFPDSTQPITALRLEIRGGILEEQKIAKYLSASLYGIRT